MLEGTKLVSNDMKTLRNTAGETIHDVIMVESQVTNTRTNAKPTWNKLIVFKSGYSLEITDCGTFWVNKPIDTKNTIQKELTRRKKLVHHVTQAEYTIEVFGSIDI